jgi:hypothetical protein
MLAAAISQKPIRILSYTFNGDLNLPLDENDAWKMVIQLKCC